MFLIWATTKKATMDVSLQVFVWLYDYISSSRSQMARLYGWVGICITMQETATLFSKVVLPFSIPTSRRRQFQFLHIFANTS